MKHTAATVSVIVGAIALYLLSPPFVVWVIIHWPGGFSGPIVKFLTFFYTPARILGDHFPVYLDLSPLKVPGWEFTTSP